MKRALVISIAGALLLAGCSQAEAAPTVAPTSTANSTPTATPPADPAPTALPPSAGPEVDLLIQTCLDRSAFAFAAPAEPSLAEARVLERSVDPPWFIYVPMSTGNGPGAAVCIFTDDLSETEGIWGGMSPLTEEQIAEYLESNEPMSVAQ